MPYFIAIQYSYQHVTVTVANQQTILAIQTINKIQALSLLIPAVSRLLQEHNLTLSDLAFCAVNNGPGPFNTLRSIIATVNAFAFAKHVPLIACNGLDLLINEINETHVVGLLDAFGHDVYYAIKSNGVQGYQSIEKVMNTCNTMYQNSTLHFIGNGAIKHQAFISNNFTGTAIIHDMITFASEQTFVDAAYTKYCHQASEKEIFPLYFESPVIKP